MWILCLALSGCLSHPGGIPVFSERLPASHNFAPDGTWWGYNMTKIARYGDTVFTYVIESDDDATTLSTFRIYAKTGNGVWRPGAGFPTSRPGNILVDSTGGLHALVFVPDNLAVSDTRGKLMHYDLAHAAAGNITDYETELVVASNSNCEPVNIRIGAAIDGRDTLAVAFGHLNENLELAETAYVRKKGRGWVRNVAGTRFANAFYYPFVLVNGDTLSLLPIQDDQVVPGEPNIYQIIPYFHFDGTAWRQECLADLRRHPLASSRRGLLEQSDLFADSSGRIHAIFKEKLDPRTGWRVTSFKHMTRSTDGQWNTADVNLGGLDLNWLKCVEIDGRLYYVGVSYDALYVFADGVLPKKVVVKDMIKSAYLYLAAPRTGTRDTEGSVDILLLSGDRAAYPDAAGLYVRMDKAALAARVHTTP